MVLCLIVMIGEFFGGLVPDIVVLHRAIGHQLVHGPG